MVEGIRYSWCHCLLVRSQELPWLSDPMTFLMMLLCRFCLPQHTWLLLSTEKCFLQVSTSTTLLLMQSQRHIYTTWHVDMFKYLISKKQNHPLQTLKSCFLVLLRYRIMSFTTFQCFFLRFDMNLLTIPSVYIMSTLGPPSHILGCQNEWVMLLSDVSSMFTLR